MRYSYPLLFFLFALVHPVAAQQAEPVSDETSESTVADLSRQRFINDGNAMNKMLNGQAYYVSNPAPVYKVEVEKAYLTPGFDPLTVFLTDGREQPLHGRLRLLDQKWEIIVEGGVFELENGLVSRVVQNGRTFVPSFDLLGRIRGVQVYEQLFKNDGVTLYCFHRADWKEPTKQTMFDTREPERTLQRKDVFLLLNSDAIALEVKNLRDVAIMFDPRLAQAARQYGKRNKLKNDAVGMVELLEYMAQYE